MSVGELGEGHFINHHIIVSADGIPCVSGSGRRFPRNRPVEADAEIIVFAVMFYFVPDIGVTFHTFLERSDRVNRFVVHFVGVKFVGVHF